MTAPRGGARAVFVNSALAFACASFIVGVIHEAAHGLVAQALGFAPKMYPFVENNPAGTPLQDILIAAGGPLASLVTGLLFAWLYARGRALYGFGRVLLCWLAFLSVIEFVNYLIVTPFLPGGDTWVIADRLGWGEIPRYFVSLIGAVVLFALGSRAAQAMYGAAPAATPLETKRDRQRYILGAFYLPAFAGIALVAPAGVGSQPIHLFYALLAAFGSTDLAGVALGSAGEAPRSGGGGERLPRIAWTGVALYVVLVAFYDFVLVHGVPV